MNKAMTATVCYQCGCTGNTDNDRIQFCSGCHRRHWFITWAEYSRAKRGFDRVALKELGPIPESSLPTEDEPVDASQVTKDNSSDFPVPFTRNDHMKPHMDWSLGTTINSKSQRDALDKQNGMIRVSPQEEYRNKEKPTVRGRAVTYGGQKTHRSSAERGGVRSKDGQLII